VARFRFIHAADIHLDSPLLGLSAYEGAPVVMLRTATRRAFVRLVDAVLEEAADFLVIAGDLYDGDWRDHNTGLFFCSQMGRLRAAGIPVYVVYGNHDAESEITRKLPLPENVRVFSAEAAETFRLERLRVALHGRSFRKRETTENLVPGYPTPNPGWFNIGVLHTALEGSAAHADYAPCSIGELAARGYDYWALGHVHAHAIVCADPPIVYPGNLQGRHIREAGARGAVLVTVDGERVGIERLDLDVLRWHHLDVDTGGLCSLPEVVTRVGECLADLMSAEGDGKPLAVRLTLSGKTAAHGSLFGLEGQLRAEILAHAVGLGADGLWVERVCIRTEPSIDRETVRARADALADIQALLEQAPGDESLAADLLPTLRKLASDAPPELTETVPELADIRAGKLDDLIRRVTPGLLARIAVEC